ncbi:MAG: hypothetical protein NTW50_03775 [Candidatus Berkelbacteria bacterium]|nr:hypothetical protein [Candidatus Berkelbacteria bacterium]
MKTIWIVLISFIATALIVGGGTYYFVHKNAVDQRNNLQNQINSLNAEISTLQSNNASSNSSSASNSISQKTTKSTLVDGKVSYTLPTGWQLKGDAPKSLGPIKSLAAVFLQPSSKPKIEFSDDYVATVAVFDTANAKSAKDWFENVAQGGFSQPNDVTNNLTINGRDTYYFKQITNSYIDVRYIIFSGEYVVYVSSRVSATHYDATTQQPDQHTDLTKYEPDIQSIANSLVISD